MKLFKKLFAKKNSYVISFKKNGEKFYYTGLFSPWMDCVEPETQGLLFLGSTKNIDEAAPFPSKFYALTEIVICEIIKGASRQVLPEVKHISIKFKIEKSSKSSEGYNYIKSIVNLLGIVSGVNDYIVKRLCVEEIKNEETC